MKKKYYRLPELPFEKNALEPNMSELQLTIHHDKHHQGYVDGANAILEKMESARKEGVELDMKSTLKALSFNMGGHILHSLFWKNLNPPKQTHKRPSGALERAIKDEFGSFEQFKKEFTQAAVSVEGSGWAALAFDRVTERLVIMQIEKHNVHIYPTFDMLLVIDVWEHTYYLDYKNQRAKFVEAFWNIVNWDEVSRRFEQASK